MTRLVAMLALTLLSACAALPPRTELAGPALPPSPVYRETLRDAPTRYHFSMRTQEEAARYGWQQLGIAFYAYAAPVPGAVAVYCETPISAPHSDYRFSTEPEAAAREDGWMRLVIAFYAFDEPAPGRVAIHTETPIGSPAGPYGYDTRDEIDARGFGWASSGVAFYAVDPHGVAPRPDDAS